MENDFASRYVTLPDPLAALEQAVAEVARLLAAAAAHPGPAMPYPGWDFDRLRRHMAELLDEFAALADGDPAAPARDPDPRPAFAAAAARARASFARPGFLPTVAPTPIGEQPGTVVVQHVVNELVSHAWDLARACDEPVRLPDELVERCRESWRAFFDDFGRPEGNFAAERPAPEGASAADRLAAYLGRTP